MLIAKMIAKILHFLGRGATTLPGRIALRLKPDILSRLSKGVKIICVTGTNGKTTACALLSHVFRQRGMSYFVNNSGANMITGVATAFIVNSTIFGKCRCQYAILECDENSMPAISRCIDADIVLVTNIFRDQLDRYGEVTHTLAKIKEGIDNMPQCKLVLNADCPLTFSLSKLCRNSYLSFGINTRSNIDVVSDSPYCPFCCGVLRYTSTVYSQLGDYSCMHCSYSRPSPDVLAEDVIDLSELGMSFLLNSLSKREYVTTSLGGMYNVYNYISSFAVLQLLGIKDASALSGFNGAFGRMERFDCGGKSALLLLVKNPVGLANCIKYVSKLKSEFDICFALNDNDADGRDVSWIWDASFTSVSRKNCRVYATGKRCYDMALRLKYDSIDSQVIPGEEYDELIGIIRSGDKDFVILSTYTSMMNMRRHFVKAFGGNAFWQEG